jgi:hypothetical protein
MNCDWEISNWYRMGSEDMNVWTCKHCRATVWLWDSKGMPKVCEEK